MSRDIIVAVAFATLPLANARAQAHAHQPTSVSAADTAATRFVADARAATQRYRDRSVAIADGYRQVGPELPAMGEHWLNIGLVLADTLDVAHPPVLIYVSSPDGPVLAGAAYTRLLGPDDGYPDFPRGLHAWHDHSGFVEDEALPTAHVRHAAVASPERTRLGILHLWMGVENPAGAWTADNWALPFARAGLLPPRRSDAAARALALAADSGRYVADVLARVGLLDSARIASMRAIMDTAAVEAVEIAPLERGKLTTEQLDLLEAIWRGVWPRIESTLPEEAVHRLADVRALWW
jgi:hypothetical protein